MDFNEVALLSFFDPNRVPQNLKTLLDAWVLAIVTSLFRGQRILLEIMSSRCLEILIHM